MRSTFKVQGFLNNERTGSKETFDGDKLRYIFRGKLLDEIQINATLRNSGDVCALIDFLNDSIHCFDNKKG